MPTFNTSLTYWIANEIYPTAILLTTSGSGGDRLLYCQPAPHIRDSTEPPKQDRNDPRGVVNFRSRERSAVSQSTTLSANPSGKDKSADVASNDPTGQNPFALHLIADRTFHGPEAGLSSAGIYSAANVPSFAIGAERGSIPVSPSIIAPTHVTTGLGPPSATTNILPGSTVGANVMDADAPSDPETRMIPVPLVGENGLPTIADFPANLILGLLHQPFQGLRRRIYVKLGRRVFVGVAFNIAPTSEEAVELPDHSFQTTPDPLSNRSMISFSVVFMMDASAPPSVLSHYTELALLTGAQIRRAELISDYLSQQRDLIVSVIERASFRLNHAENYRPTVRESSNFRRSFRWSSQLGVPPTSNLLLPRGPVGLKPTSKCASIALLQQCSDAEPNVTTTSATDVDDGEEQIHEQLATASSLCSVLKTILNSVCSTGHVNVMINHILPIYFSLPHRAYCLVSEPTFSFSAISPSAVWRAMDKIRPYHTLLLLSRKRHLLAQLPTDGNSSFRDFIHQLSPTINLRDLSVRMQSQAHCLMSALWFVYQGFAIIIYPIASSNSYVLSPFYAAWFEPSLIAQFATTFPKVNLAQVLASFSIGLTLKEQFGFRDTDDSEDKDTGNKQTQHLTADGSDEFWSNMSQAARVELVTWLLRRRLIIQVHIYVFCALVPGGLINATKCATDTDEAHTCDAVPRTNTVSTRSSTTITTTNGTAPLSVESTSYLSSYSNVDRVEVTSAPSPPGIPKDIIRELRDQFPPHTRQSAVDTVLRHPGATRNLAMLRLFVRILSHLPAHLEELMFSQSVTRSTLIECIDRFSPLLLTARLPDPVTACFAGIDWPG